MAKPVCAPYWKSGAITKMTVHRSSMSRCHPIDCAKKTSPISRRRFLRFRRQKSVAFLGFNPHSIERFPNEEHRHHKKRDCQYACEQRIVRTERHCKLDSK